ncbi:Mor transcription activator family protein [Anoxynatronum sibiricum]|uniref:Mor transcription activator family protein n=1 Tax=Anoxynatronum sibiricum TaxID=210623 RepID=A0ABU9VX41_9CLOT
MKPPSKYSYLNDIYREIAEVFDEDTATRFYQHFKGLQITYPVRLYDREHTFAQIKKEYNGSNVKALAQKYHYSERWIRKMLEEK